MTQVMCQIRKKICTQLQVNGKEQYANSEFTPDQDSNVWLGNANGNHVHNLQCQRKVDTKVTASAKLWKQFQ